MRTARPCARLEAEGIDCAGLATSASASTGVALIVVDDASQNAIVIVAGGNGEVTTETVARHEAALASADVLICQLETPPDTVFAALSTGRRLGRTVVLNPAPAVAPLPDGWLPLVDYLIPNEVEAAALTGQPVRDPADAEAAARVLQAGGARNVLVTLGARGVLALTADGAARHYPAPAVQAVDTTAAGDTFIGGFFRTARGRRGRRYGHPLRATRSGTVGHASGRAAFDSHAGRTGLTGPDQSSRPARRRRRPAASPRRSPAAESLPSPGFQHTLKSTLFVQQFVMNRRIIRKITQTPSSCAVHGRKCTN